MVQSVTASFKGASEGAYRLYIEDYLRLIISLIPLVNFRNFGAGARYAFNLGSAAVLFEDERLAEYLRFQ